MHIHSYITSAKGIIELYDGTVPLSAWLKNYYSQHKKFGSKDRRFISHLCYSFYRLGKAFDPLPIEERIKLAQFITSEQSTPLLEAINNDWNNKASLSIAEKLSLLNVSPDEVNIFPFLTHLSSEIDPQNFTRSHLIQPDLFLRIRPRKEQAVAAKLSNHNIPFQQVTPNSIRLSNATKTDDILELDKEAVVQDLSSQQVLAPLLEVIADKHTSLSAWDCCAASGGKSLLLRDNYPNINLTVSDVRKSILINLERRFARAGIKNYRSFVADVSSPGFSRKDQFDLILCDAPCSGSGTWGRTPEQLVFFKEEKINYYSDLQKKIATNAARRLKGGGYFLYITCSVFREENEGVVEHLQKNTALTLLSMRYIKGYDLKADTLFVALFTSLP